MEAQGGGLLHTNMTYSRRREGGDRGWHTLGCQLLTRKRTTENQRTCGKWYCHTHRTLCTMVIKISLQMGQKHRKAFSPGARWRNSQMLQIVAITIDCYSNYNHSCSYCQYFISSASIFLCVIITAKATHVSVFPLDFIYIVPNHSSCCKGL